MKACRERKQSSVADKEKSTRAAADQPPPPTDATLREAALRHLARYAATEARLRLILHRRIDRWARAAELAGAEHDTVTLARNAARAAAARVVAKLAETGVVSDAQFAEARARRLRRAGKSTAATTRHLTERGVAPTLARAAAGNDDSTELAGALLLLRRRRAGPFAERAETAPDPTLRPRILAALARAGFSRATAERALGTGREEAEIHIARLRR